MNQPTHSNTALVLGVFLSALLHLAAGLAVARWVDEAPPADPASTSPEPAVEQERPRVRLGLERSRNITVNWIGFEQPTPHSAEQADVEQPELTMDPAGGGAPAPERIAATEPQAAPTPATAPPAGAPAPMAVRPGPIGPEEGNAPVAPAAPSVAVEPAVTEASPAPRPAEPTRVSLDPPAPSPVDVALPDPEPPPRERAARGAGAGEAPGAAAERESSATALTQTLEVRLGRPAAAEGLEINTVRPRWRNTTLLTANPRNPTVWITFGRDGKVKKAGFVKQGTKVLGTGYPEVDQPLLNAIYRWTAKGEALADIPAFPEGTPVEEQPGLTIRIKVVLIG